MRVSFRSVSLPFSSWLLPGSVSRSPRSPSRDGKFPSHALQGLATGEAFLSRLLHDVSAGYFVFLRGWCTSFAIHLIQQSLRLSKSPDLRQTSPRRSRILFSGIQNLTAFPAQPEMILYPPATRWSRSPVIHTCHAVPVLGS
jgi:hypothetical protein